MFASHEKNLGKKLFQKPNILRRKTKVSIPKSNISNESPKARSLVTTHVENVNISDHLDKITLEAKDTRPSNTIKTAWKLTLANSLQDNDVLTAAEIDNDANSNTSICTNIAQNTNVKSLEQNPLNIESFIYDGANQQDTIYSYDATVSTENKLSQAKNKWVFNISDNPMDIIINNCREQQSDLERRMNRVIVAPLTPISNQPQVSDQTSGSTTPGENISVECFSSKPVKLKCNHPNCNKGFWTEEKLEKHKISHNKQMLKTQSQTPIECPVKKVAEDGTEDKCPRTFDVRVDLLKHLNEDHTLEDAQHRCSVCGRRFFWAMGLRAHGASECARGGLACAWPGCGRVFRLPCRLREHARAHTGDRPYLCRYPDCGWAFRSASKLLRHARRHTDDRKHACSTCGRAFMRREHLRDHYARHHQPTARATHLCTHPGCEQTFTNMSTLYLHMKKVHRKVEKPGVPNDTIVQSATVNENGENIYLVSMVPELGVDEDVTAGEETSVDAEAGGEREVEREVEGEGEGGVGSAVSAWHAARTHCTWPLARHPPAAYVLDDDVHVERAEGSGSDVYTVRSDLFLHGNVPIDEDSQHMVGAAAGTPLDADLCLIDAHPTIDLMQEELMYEDAAVDETSFRVFLMNGEELT